MLYIDSSQRKISKLQINPNEQNQNKTKHCSVLLENVGS